MPSVSARKASPRTPHSSWCFCWVVRSPGSLGLSASTLRNGKGRKEEGGVKVCLFVCFSSFFFFLGGGAGRVTYRDFDGFSGLFVLRFLRV